MASTSRTRRSSAATAQPAAKKTKNDNAAENQLKPLSAENLENLETPIKYVVLDDKQWASIAGLLKEKHFLLNPNPEHKRMMLECILTHFANPLINLSKTNSIEENKKLRTKHGLESIVKKHPDNALDNKNQTITFNSTNKFKQNIKKQELMSELAGLAGLDATKINFNKFLKMNDVLEMHKATLNDDLITKHPKCSNKEWEDIKTRLIEKKCVTLQNNSYVNMHGVLTVIMQNGSYELINNKEERAAIKSAFKSLYDNRQNLLKAALETMLELRKEKAAAAEAAAALENAQ